MPIGGSKKGKTWSRIEKGNKNENKIGGDIQEAGTRLMCQIWKHGCGTVISKITCFFSRSNSYEYYYFAPETTAMGHRWGFDSPPMSIGDLPWVFTSGRLI